MSKILSYEDKLRGDFRRYLIKIATTKVSPELTELEILKAFDLAVQKQKLTSLEHELLETKRDEVKMSKIDVSGSLIDAMKFIARPEESYNDGKEAPALVIYARTVLTRLGIEYL